MDKSNAERPSQPGSGFVPMTPRALVRKSTVVYGIMTLIGLAVVAFGHKHLPVVLGIPSDLADLADFGRFAAIGIVGAGLLMVLSYFFEDWFVSFRELKALMTRYLGQVSIATAIYLAVITSVGEELVFRGALQPFAGLVLTSVLFGLLHMGQNGLVSAWSVWALIAGLLLGWMYDETRSLWPPIIAHFTVNAVSILSLRRSYRGFVEQAAGEATVSTPREGD